MERVEYRDVVDKSAWPRGPWDGEPDKAQWPDAATGLPCLIRRGPMGSLCGYAGVPPGHALHGVKENERACGFDVHGGVTFAGPCQDASREAWEVWRTGVSNLLTGGGRASFEAAVEPWTPFCYGSFDRWVARSHQIAICHVAAPGEPDPVWWFGFDCAHAGDLLPGMPGLELRGPFPRSFRGTYRDWGYVEGECSSLAGQLAGRRSREEFVFTCVMCLRFVVANELSMAAGPALCQECVARVLNAGGDGVVQRVPGGAGAYRIPAGVNVMSTGSRPPDAVPRREPKPPGWAERFAGLDIPGRGEGE